MEEGANITNEKTYAERVTNLYRRVSSELGEEKAKIFNEFVRGGSLLDDEDYKLIDNVETLETEKLESVIEGLEADKEKLLKDYNCESLYEVGKTIAERGRTKLYVWKDGEYKELEVKKDEERFLPWSGKIQAGGPETHPISGIVQWGVNREYNIDIEKTQITINGHTFSNIKST